MQMLDRLLTKLHANGHRVVLFSQFTTMLNLIEEYCELRGWRYCRLDGSVNRVQRTVDISCFNAPGSKLFIFLMSTRAGGLGVNLQSADTCILYDSDWNPQPDLQAMARVHRIGQKKKVHVYRLVATGTVEERIVQRAEKKLYLDQMVNRPGQLTTYEAKENEQDDVSSSEMLKALRFGAQSIFSGQGGDVGATDDELDAIIDRSRTGNESVGKLKGGTCFDASEFSAESVSVKLRQFEGQVYGAEKEVTFQNCKSVADIGAAWQQIQTASRERKSRVTSEWVKGVGEVQVLSENNVTMEGASRDEGQPDGNAPRAAQKAGNNRQIAGRDYDHESHCLSCWDGGDLVCCDVCPAAFHPQCLGLKSADDIPNFGVFACPHHSCATCGRKSPAAGGLLFRCMMCPSAFCEDHLPANACIVGHNERFSALGFNHPKQGCYVFCNADCVMFAHEQGLATEDVIQASAAMVLGTTGVDLTKKPAKKRVGFETDTRTNLQKLSEFEREELLLALNHPVRTVREDLANFEKMAAAKDDRGSAVDTLHDLIFETSRSTEHTYDGHRKCCVEAISRIASWSGVTASAGGSADALAEQAAEFYIRVSQDLGELRGCEVKAAARAIGAMRVTQANNNIQLKPVVESGCPKKAMIHAVALFLTRPATASLCMYITANNGTSEAVKLSNRFASVSLAMKLKILPKRLDLKHPMASRSYILYPMLIPELRAGDWVELHGLSSVAFNGKQGKVTIAANSMGRVSVTLEDGSTRSLKPQNLRLNKPKTLPAKPPALSGKHGAGLVPVPPQAAAKPKSKSIDDFFRAKPAIDPKPVSETEPMVVDLCSTSDEDQAEQEVPCISEKLQEAVLTQFASNPTQMFSDGEVVSAQLQAHPGETPAGIQTTVDRLVLQGSLLRERGQLRLPTPTNLKRALDKSAVEDISVACIDKKAKVEPESCP